ncbi:MAG: DUF1646 family protein [Promethearchaeati archaeon SRVP18_Atabeyarchaeia-1]
MELLLILVAIFILPLSVRRIEEELEVFLFLMGVIAVTITWQWSLGLMIDAIIEPVTITLAVLVSGLVFMLLKKRLARKFGEAVKRVGEKSFFFVVVVGFGIVSSTITAIVAALLLVEIVSAIDLGRRNEITLVVFACYSIGLGSVLTPLGGPLAAITVAKLGGAPHYAGFWFLFENLWPYILPGIVLLGVLSTMMISKNEDRSGDLKEDRQGNLKEVLTRAAKIYVFIMSLVFIGAAFKPLMEAYVPTIQPYFLYWINSASSVLDNATLAAAEIWPAMTLVQINCAMLGLSIAGGMLIPGNIPNIISSGKLKIRSREWARLGVPLGVGILLLYFAVIIV